VTELTFSLLLLAVGGIVWSFRRTSNAAALWTWGWVILGGTSFFLLGAGDTLWSPVAVLLLSALLPAFMLAGALAYAGRPVPGWLLPGALALGAVRWGLAQSPLPVTSHLIGMVGEPGVELLAAWLVHGVARSPGASLAQRVLAPSFVLVAALDGATAFYVFRGPFVPGLFSAFWGIVGLATLGLQITAAGHRSRELGRVSQAEGERIRRALRESERRFAMLAENATDLITEMDEAGHLLYVSPSVQQILGRPSAELTDSPGLDWVHAEDRDRAARAIAAALEDDLRAPVLFRCLHRDGSWRWIEATLRSFHDPHGATRLVAVSRDVTERHEQQQSLRRSHDTLERRVELSTTELRAALAEVEREVEARRRTEQELRASRERYRMVSELSSDLSFSFWLAADGQQRTEWVTDAFARLTGYAIEEVEELGWAQVVHPDDIEMARWQMAEVLAGGRVAFEVRILTRSGETRWVHTRMQGTRVPEEGGLRVVGACRDITERRQAQEERERFQAHLNETQRLESLGRLAGGIAHDFNNLLSVILGNTSLMLLDVPSDSDVANRLARVRSAAQHAARLTEQMLTYSGKTRFALKPIELSRVVADTRDLLEASLSKRSELQLELSNAATVMDGDDTQLRQVVVNLVANAAEALGDEGGTVRVRTDVVNVGPTELARAIGIPDPEPGPFVLLEVTDTGPGIDAAAQERIFDPFFSTRRSGRGLGLATVVGIVRGHRGVILLDSTPGLGSRFRVLFPLSSGAVEASTPAPPQPPEPARARATVLIVDDEEDVLELGATFLARAGFEVRTAAGGRAALDLLRSRGHAIDVVVLDLVMPGMGGEETFREIRRLRADLPVVLTSGYDEESIVDRFSAEKLTGFLAKPYEAEQLVRKIQSALDL
jgi:PAS domain S-box-containing protein